MRRKTKFVVRKKRGVKVVAKTDARVDVGEYQIAKVVNHRIEKRDGVWVATFRCRWKNYTADDDTWEPLDMLMKCPILTMDYVLAKVKQLVVYHNNLQLPPPPKNALPPPSEQQCFDHYKSQEDMAYIPDGSEVVRSILTELSIAGCTYVVVAFRHLKPDVVQVPRCFMDYYYPTEMVLFLRKFGSVSG